MAEVIQLVGGAWPADSAQWKISDNDGVRMLDAGQLELFIEPAGQPIHVSTSSLGRRFLRSSNPDDDGADHHAALAEPPYRREVATHRRLNLPKLPTPRWAARRPGP